MAIAESIGISDLLDTDVGKESFRWTRQELWRLKKIIERDNINFSEKWTFDSKDKIIQNAFDKHLDEEFDKYLRKKWPEIKSIINSAETPANKQKRISEIFNKHLQALKEQWDPELNNYINQLKQLDIQSNIDLTKIELNVLEDTVLSSINSVSWSWYINRSWGLSDNPTRGWTQNQTQEKTDEEDSDRFHIFKRKNKKTADSKESEEDSTNDEEKNTENKTLNNYSKRSHDVNSYLDFSADTTNDVDEDQDKKALRKMLFNSDKQFETSLDNYKIKWEEKKQLKALKKAIKEIWLWKDEFSLAFKHAADAYHTGKTGWENSPELSGINDTQDWKEALITLGKIYALSQKDANDLPYLNKVIWLLETEIIKNKKTDLSDIYNSNNDLPADKDLDLVGTKFFVRDSKEAKTYIETMDSNVSKEIQNKLNEYNEKNNLQWIVIKFIDLSKKNLENGEEHYYSWQGEEKEILEFLKTTLAWDWTELKDLYETLQWTQNPINPGALKLFNAMVFSDMNLKEYANANKINEKINTKLDKNILFINQLADFQFDGKNSFNDGNRKTWLQVKELYYQAADTIWMDKTLNNLLDVALMWADQQWVVAYKKEIEKIQKSANKYETLINIINWSKSEDPIYGLKENETDIPGDKWFLKFLQNTLVNSPIEAYDILRNWKEAFNKYQEDINTLNDVDRKKIENAIDKKLPWIELDPIVKAGLMEMISNIATPNKNSQTLTNTWLGLWTQLSLDEVLKWLTINVGAGLVDGKPSVWGIMLGWDKQRKIDNQSKLHAGIAWWVGGFMFIPLWSINGGWERAIKNKTSWELELKNQYTLDATWNFTMIWIIPSFGISAGVNIERLSAIEKQSNDIKNKVAKSIDPIIAWLEWINDRQSRIDIIKKGILKQFPESKNSPEIIDQATYSIFEALTYFGAFEDGKAFDKNQVTTMTRLLSDFYASNRKDEQLRGITKWKFQWFSVGVQFLAWYFPVPSVCAKISRYKNEYYQDTESSLKTLDVADQEGFGNEKKEGKPVDNVNYINNILKREFKWESKDSPEIKADESGKFLLIPNQLWTKRYLNIVLDPKLKWTLEKIENPDTTKKALWTLKVPANVDYRLEDQSRGSNRSYILNIWDIVSESDDLVLNTQSSKIPEEWFGKNEISANDINTYQASIDFSLWFKNLRDTFNNIEKDNILLNSLLKLDDTLKDNFYKFLEGSHQSNQNKSKQALISLFESNNNVRSDANISSLITVLKWKNEQEIAFVIDEMKIIFARDLSIDTRGWPKKIREKMGEHGTWREHLKWPSGREFKKYGNLLDELHWIKESMKTEKTNLYEPKNLFWYTAWYRSQYRNYDHRNYSITTPWSTEISKEWNYNYIKPIEKNKKEALQWFTDNFKKDSPEQAILNNYLSNITTAVADKYGITSQTDRQLLTQIDIIPLLNWENTTITLADDRKITISMETVPVFYLLKACANESLWVDIKDIKVDIISPEWFYTNTSETRSTVHVKDLQERNAGISFQKKQAPKNSGNAWDEVTSQSPTWNSGDNVTELPPAEQSTPIENPTDWS